MEVRFSHSFNVQLKEKEYVEKCLEIYTYDRKNNPYDTNGMMEPTYESIDYAKGEIIMGFEVLPWEVNVAGILHGGVITTMLDHTAGSLVYAFLGHWIPTIDINVKFISQAEIGDRMKCKGRIIHFGGHIVIAEVILVNVKNDRIVAKASIVYASDVKRPLI